MTADVALRPTLLAMLCVAVVPLGCAGEPARAIATVAFTAWSLVAFWAHRRDGWLPPSTIWWLLLLAIAGLQLLPIALPLDGAVFGDATAAHLTQVPTRTWARLAEVAAALAAFVATAQVFRTARHGRSLAIGGLAFGSLLAVYGFLAAAGIAPLVDASQTRTVLVATFVNRNHTADLLAVLALLGVGFVAAEAGTGRAAWRRVAAVVAILLCVAGVLATASRGALLALGAGALAFPLFATRNAWRKGPVLATAAGLAIAVLWLVPDGFLERFGSVSGELRGAGSRADIWRGAVALWWTAPLLGTGLGTYGDLSPATQSAAIPGRIEHAHCDPLELLAETGALGLGLALLGVLTFVVVIARRGLAQRDRQRTMLAAGALAAVVATLAHALVEFHLQLPANAAWLAAVAGMAAGTTRPATVREAMLPRCGLLAAAAAGLVACLLGGLRVAAAPELDGLAAIERGRALLSTDAVAASAAAETALACNPYSPRAHRLAGEAWLARGNRDEALAAFDRGLHWTNPSDRPRHQLEVARTCLGTGAVDVAAALLHDVLPALPPAGRRAALAELHDLLPAGEALLLVLADQPQPVLESLAGLLLERGDFRGREAVLAAAGPGAAPALLTLRDGVWMTSAEVHTEAKGANLVVSVDLGFLQRAEAAPADVVLCCDGPGAAFRRAFRVDAASSHHTFTVDTTCPPGVYDVTLAFRDGAPRCQLGTVEHIATTLDLSDGSTVAACELHWSTAPPERRARPRLGLPLRIGDVAWRQVEFSATPSDLVVETVTPSRLDVRIDDTPLTPAVDVAVGVHRFALPARRGGRLELRARDADGPVLVRLFVAPRRK